MNFHSVVCSSGVVVIVIIIYIYESYSTVHYTLLLTFFFVFHLKGYLAS